MVLMAGMLPGVEFARRRRRLRPAGGSSAEEPCAGTRRPSSFCLYAAANWHDHHAHLGSAGFLTQRSSACEETAWTTLDSNAREAKERLDQKLRSQRESVVKRHHSTGSLRLPASTTSDVADAVHHSAKDTTATATSVLQREVFSKKGARGRRFSWGRMGARKAASTSEPPPPPPQQQQQAECAVCLEEFRAGDVLAHLPCAHRFHWACAVPWVRAASRCPFCRAAVHLPATDV